MIQVHYQILWYRYIIKDYDTGTLSKIMIQVHYQSQNQKYLNMFVTGSNETDCQQIRIQNIVIHSLSNIKKKQEYTTFFRAFAKLIFRLPRCCAKIPKMMTRTYSFGFFCGQCCGTKFFGRPRLRKFRKPISAPAKGARLWQCKF